MPLLVSLKKSGYKLLVLQVGDTEASEPPGLLAWHHIRQPEDFARVGAEETG